MIGTNEANSRGTGLSGALIVWLGTSKEAKALPASCTVASGWTLGSNQLGPYLYGQGSGTATCTITTYGGLIYLFHPMADGVSGTASYRIPEVLPGREPSAGRRD